VIKTDESLERIDLTLLQFDPLLLHTDLFLLFLHGVDEHDVNAVVFDSFDFYLGIVGDEQGLNPGHFFGGKPEIA